MDDAIEILREAMRQVERGTAVNPDRTIDLNDGDPVPAHPSRDVLGKFVSVIATTVPGGRANYFPGRRRDAEYPGQFLQPDAGCRIEDRWRRAVQDLGLLR